MPSEWNEDEHPRGQPDNKGQFVKKIFMYPAKRCDRWAILNINELPDGTRTPARIIIDNGSYISPKVKKY